MPEYRHIQRQFGPVYDENSKILILGSFPSVKSREVNFFYGHPQNRFWPLMARVLGCAVPQSIEEKKAMLLANGVALWDVLASCEITGSADSSIKNAVPNDLSAILSSANIRRIYTNGKTSKNYYKRFSEEITEEGFPYGIGAEYTGGSVADGLEIVEIPAYTYAVFTVKGKMPDAFRETYRRVCTEFFQQSDYEYGNGVEIEVYPSADVQNPDYTCELWIAVKHK